jgi:sugar lactone lactonase YvrE
MSAAISQGRAATGQAAELAEGWSLSRLTAPSRLYGANGMRAGADGRIYIAQCVGSTISAMDPDSGALEVISGLGGEIVAPDDLDFDVHGNLYATEVMDARVSVRMRDGRTRVLRADTPAANGITFHQDRLFIDECRPGGRLLELDLDGGAPRLVADNLPMPNALAPGPDGYLYFPLLGADEIWRVHPDGGSPERVVGDLHHPVAVKIDSAGYIVSPQSGVGEVWRIDPRSGAKSVLAKLDPCIDNLVFLGERLFVSHMSDGRITEVLSGGATREVLPGGLQFPLDMAWGPDGRLYFSDNVVLYGLRPGGTPEVVGRLFDAGYPGTTRGVALTSDGGFVLTTADGRVALWRRETKSYELLAEGLDQVYAAAVTPKDEAVVAEQGAGRVLLLRGGGEVEVLAQGLAEPTGVAIASDGGCYVSESGAGRVVRVSGGRAETVLDGLRRPHGVAVRDGMLYVVDAAAKTVTALDLATGESRTIASGLPVGAPPGITPKPLRGFMPFVGPMGPLTGLAAAPDGTLYVGGDAEGSILALRPDAAG